MTDGTQIKGGDPNVGGKGTLNVEEVQKKYPWLLKKYIEGSKTEEEAIGKQAMSYPAAQTTMNQEIEKRHKLETTQKNIEDIEKIVLEKDAENQRLTKQANIARSAGQVGRTGDYNPQALVKVEELVGLKAGEGADFMDLVRSAGKYDRDSENSEKTRVAIQKAKARQWKDAKKNYDAEKLEEIGPEFVKVIEKYPQIANNAHNDDDAIDTLIGIASVRHELRKKELEDDDKLREEEKLVAETSRPGGGTGASEAEVERFHTMPIKELEDELVAGGLLEKKEEEGGSFIFDPDKK